MQGEGELPGPRFPGWGGRVRFPLLGGEAGELIICLLSETNSVKKGSKLSPLCQIPSLLCTV